MQTKSCKSNKLEYMWIFEAKCIMILIVPSLVTTTDMTYYYNYNQSSVG